MTEKPPLLDRDETVFILADVVHLFQRKKKHLCRAALSGAFLVFVLLSLYSDPKYPLQATFKEGAEIRSDASLFKLALGIGSTSSECQASALMKSFQVLKPLVEQLGLQASVIHGRGMSRFYQRIRDNLKAEMGKPLEDIDAFVFRDVLYEGEDVLKLSITFQDQTHFSIFSKKQLMAEGTLGSSVILPQASLTIEHIPATILLQRAYPLHIHPWAPCVKTVSSQLQIVSNKFNKSIYDLTFDHRDKHFGKKFLNALMAEYQKYLKRDHDQISKSQLDYLAQKQEEIYDQLSGVFDEYTAYLQQNVQSQGQIGLKDELRELSESCRNLSSKLFAIDTELGLLDVMQKEDKALCLSVAPPFAHEIQNILKQIHDLKQQRDLMEISVKNNTSESHAGIQYGVRQEELKEIRKRQDTVRQLFEVVEKKQPLPKESLLNNEPLVLWASHLNESQSRERTDFSDYLENYLHLLSVQEKMLQERVSYESIPEEFHGIDLTTARTLFVEYTNRFNASEESMRHFDQLRQEILRNDFELSSLGSVLHDPVSQRLIQDASALVLHLKDEKHRFEKEGERWKEELDLQKKVLIDHLAQLGEVEKIKANLLREKIVGLQQAILDALNSQISVLSERFGDSVKERRISLNHEKQVLEQKLEELRTSFPDLPEKWRREKWLNLKTTMGTAMIQSTTELVESKTIGHHLHHVASKPLDWATLPPLPLSPHLLPLTLLGALLAVFGVFSLFLLKMLAQGFPISSEKLKVMRFPFLGEISPFCDGPEGDMPKGTDLDVLRQAVLFVSEKKIIALIGGRGPDYSYAMGKTLGKIGRRSLIVRCDFGMKFHPKDLPGVMQVWKGETENIPIRRGDGFDYLMSGGFFPFGVEVIQSKIFLNLLETVKKNYDHIFLLFRSSLNCAEPLAALNLCDQAIVTTTDESTEQLTPFLNWAYHEGRCRLAFIHVNRK